MEIINVPTAPVAGTNEVQTITRTGLPTAGTFKLGYRYDQTTALNWNATATEIRDALRALNEVQADGVSGVTGGPIQTTPAVVTFGGHLGVADVQLLSVVNVNLVGGGYAVTVTTPGVDATLRGHGKGTVVVTDDTGKMYVNEGTATAPSWKLVTTT